MVIRRGLIALLAWHQIYPTLSWLWLIPLALQFAMLTLGISLLVAAFAIIGIGCRFPGARDVDAGDSIKLSVEWSGDGNLDFFDPPDLARIERPARDARLDHRHEDRQQVAFAVQRLELRTVECGQALLVERLQHVVDRAADVLLVGPGDR